MASYKSFKAGYTVLWNGMTVNNRAAAQKEARAIIAAKTRLKGVQALTNAPWFFIGLMLGREAGYPGGHLNFNAVLHNGQVIVGTNKKTTIVPKGRGPFATFEESAIDAAKLKGFGGGEWGPERIAYETEAFNGFGYRNKRINIPSPYLWGGTNRQQRGKYIKDGVFDKTVMDSQLGTMAVLKMLMELDPEVRFDGPLLQAPAQPTTATAVDIYDGQSHPEIEAVQKRFEALKMPEFGSVDGRWGPKMKQVVLGFRAEHGLPGTLTGPFIDDEFLAALMTATPREVAPERANATVADLRAKGAEDIVEADKTQLVGNVTTGVGVAVGAGKVADATGLLDKAQQYSGVMQQIMDVVTPISGFVQQNFWLLMIAAGGLVVWQTGVLKNIRLLKHQSGEDVSK